MTTRSYAANPRFAEVPYLYNGQKALPLDLNALHNDELWSALGGNVPVSDSVRRLYETVSILHRCVRIRANGLFKVPWVIANASGDTVWKRGDEPPPDLQFLKPLSRLLYKTEAALCLGAQAYWHKERNRVRVTNLRWLAPVATEPYWDQERGLTHFRYNNGVRVTELPVGDVVYLWYQHPLHETLRDVSPGEASMAAAGVLYNVDAFTAGFFSRGAIKAMILGVTGSPPKEERDRIKAWWSRTVNGVKNAFKTEVVNADSIKPVVVGEGIQELSNTELTEEKRADIAVGMGIPLSMVFSDAANYATAQQDEQNFYNSTIIPDCELLAEQVDEQLLAPYGYHLVFKPETMDVFQTDENERAQSFATYVGARMPKSLIAEMLGMELPDGWTYADLDVEEEPEPAAGPSGSAKEVVTDEDVESEESQAAEDQQEQRRRETQRFKAWVRKRANADPAKFKSELLSETDKAALLMEMGGGAGQPFFLRTGIALPDGAITPDAYKALVLQLDPEEGPDGEAEQRIREEIERRFERRLYGAFREQLTKLLPDDADDDAIRAAPSQVTATSEPVREVLRRELEQASSLGVTVALDTLGRVGLGFDWTLANTDAARWASQYSFELVRNINHTTAQRLQVAVDDWFKERTTLPDLVRELTPTFGRKRARLIAQTETTRAAREGSVLGFEQSGVVTEAEWVTVADERVCPTCGRLHGKRASLRGTFEGLSYPPAHPGCRCFVRPVIGEPSDSQLIAASAPATPAGPKPNGPPVSGALKLPSSGKYKPVYEEAVSAIDEVHGDGALPELPVTTKSSMDAYGQYRYEMRSGKPVDILINGQGDHHQLTLAHEIGHFLDHQALGEKGKMASERDPALQAWRDAVDKSQAVERLRDKRRNPLRYQAEVEVAGSKFITRPDPIFTSYLLDRRELWARSYAQYVAQRSGNTNLLAQLAAQRTSAIYGDQQWEDEDFAPIAAAIDDLFRSLGWRLS